MGLEVLVDERVSVGGKALLFVTDMPLTQKVKDHRKLQL